MRKLEIILSCVALCVVIYSLIKGRRKDNIKYLSLLLLIPVMVAHVIFEGIRWQMYGVYAYIIYLAFQFLFLRKKRLSIEESGPKKWTVWLSAIILILSISLSFLFRMNEMPKLTGDYEVGTVSLDLVDDLRSEIYGDKTGEPRKIRIQFWYPIDDHANKKIVPWMADGILVARGVTKVAYLPGFLMESAAQISSNSYGNANLSNSEKTYPVVIISHGWTGFRNLHTDVGEMLASHGYIAISIDHTYGSIATVFDNGEIATLDRSALPSREETLDFLTYADKLVTTYAYDTRLVLDYLENLTSDSLFYQRIDLDKMGVLGHSTGGGGVVKLSLEDTRIKAVFGLDAWVEPIGYDTLSKGLSIPSLFIRSESWEEGQNNAYLKTLVNNSEIEPITLQINGSNHLDFTMLYMYQPLYRYIGYSGELDAYLNAKIQRELILNFFDITLKDSTDLIQSIEEKYEPVIKIKF
ncbi:MAG: dienelactone hydrolase family protein [Mobilitalea sp.]